MTTHRADAAYDRLHPDLAPGESAMRTGFREGWGARAQAETQKHEDDITFEEWVKTWEVRPSPAIRCALEQAWHAALAHERGESE